MAYDSYSRMEKTLLKCQWYRTNLEGRNRTIIHDDECGFTKVKTSTTIRQDWSTSDPFAFPHAVEQCFYVPHPSDPEDWSIVIPYVPRARSVVQAEDEYIVVEGTEDME